jgi:glutamate racemase
MAIGVFDSGVGGLTIHRALSARFPRADLIYLADQAHAPYGPRGGEEIVALTRAGCETLFGAGATLVVLACNTASAIALRRLQQEWLPGLRAGGRPLNALGIIVPTIEAATGLPWSHPGIEPQPQAPVRTLGVFSTAATARSAVYETEVAKRRHDVRVVTEPCPELAGMIEAGAPEAALRAAVDAHAAALVARIGGPPDGAVLGCTHYEIVGDMFRAALPPGVPLIHQPDATAAALEDYLARHPEHAADGTGARRFLTTGRAARHALAEAFWGGPLAFEPAAAAPRPAA